MNRINVVSNSKNRDGGKRLRDKYRVCKKRVTNMTFYGRIPMIPKNHHNGISRREIIEKIPASLETMSKLTLFKVIILM